MFFTIATVFISESIVHQANRGPPAVHLSRVWPRVAARGHGAVWGRSGLRQRSYPVRQRPQYEELQRRKQKFTELHNRQQ